MEGKGIGLKSRTQYTTITTDEFGTYQDKSTCKQVNVRRYTFKNAHSIEVQVITYGATVTSMKLPDNKGKKADVVLGFDKIEGYLLPQNPYFGATVGRVANRIGGAKFKIYDKEYKVSANHGGVHMLHGGFKGFDKVNWESFVSGESVVMSYDSPDGEEGFPGNVLVNAIFTLTDDDTFMIEYKAICTKPTYVNLTNHGYFNLAGHDKGSTELYKHLVSINADAITEYDKDSIPTGKLQRVGGTVFDLRNGKIIGPLMSQTPKALGFDHNFCVKHGPKPGVVHVARVHHPASGRTMDIRSNQFGVQFYTSNFMPDEDDQTKSIPGKCGKKYYKHGALCLETQNYPDAINHPEFPNAILNPGELYHHIVEYNFVIGSTPVSCPC